MDTDASVTVPVPAGLLDCPVCQERLRTPITTCVNGHAICKNCKAALVACPVCRGCFAFNKNWFANQLLDSIPMPCKNEINGCEVKVLSKDIDKHERECDFSVPYFYTCEIATEFKMFLFDNEHLFVSRAIQEKDQFALCVYYIGLPADSSKFECKVVVEQSVHKYEYIEAPLPYSYYPDETLSHPLCHSLNITPFRPPWRNVGYQYQITISSLRV